MEHEPELSDIAEQRDVYRFRGNSDLVIALGSVSLEFLIGLRAAFELQLANVQADIDHLDVAIEHRSGERTT